MKIILCGYHWAGCKALELLLEEDNEIFVFTHSMDKSVCDLEGLCIKKGIAYSLDKICVENMPFIPDVICSIYYRYIISKDVISLVSGKIFNLHPALLPKYRGCSSLTWAMINGEKECGYTYHYIDENCDTGNIILQKSLKIEEFDTQLTLYNRVMFEALKDFKDAFNKVVNGYPGNIQSGKPSYYKRGCPLDGKLDALMNETEAERFIRAMIYPPYPPAKYEGMEIFTIQEYKKFKKSL